MTRHGDVLIDDVRPYVERSIEHARLEQEQREREEAQRKELERERQLRQVRAAQADQARPLRGEIVF